MIGPEFPATLDAARQGDHPALERLYRDTAPVVLGYLRGLGAPDAEDLTGEVYVAMVTGLDRFDGDERQFRSWLLTIAHRRRADAARRWARRPEDPVAPDALPDGVEPTSTSALATNRLEVDHVLAAIDELTEDQRAVLLLRTVADLPIEQVAEILGKPVTAVKALQRRAQASLLRKLPERSP